MNQKTIKSVEIHESIEKENVHLTAFVTALQSLFWKLMFKRIKPFSVYPELKILRNFKFCYLQYYFS